LPPKAACTRRVGIEAFRETYEVAIAVRKCGKTKVSERLRCHRWWEPAAFSSGADYVELYLSDGFTVEAAANAPSLAWNRDDALQDMLLRKAFRRSIARPVHYVPTAEGFGAAVRAGLGWGMYPAQLAAAALAGGSIAQISDVHLDVPLDWQCWKLDSPMVKAITDVVSAAAANLNRRRK
jgi:LysR family transcriptional regulator, chromosome initiation inhibitor